MTPTLVCPTCRARLDERGSDALLCTTCDVVYPIDRGVPILVPKTGSLFSAAAATSNTEAHASSSGSRAPLLARISRALPQLSANAGGRDRFLAVQRAIDVPRARALILGAGDDAAYIAGLRATFGEVVATDVVRHDGIDVVCDGHALPFEDDAFDYVGLPAVLEHVLDPQQVVAETTRVLRKGGVVSAETPFLQSVHMGAYDFHRFTDLGHRWLFRCYDELERGVSSGPAVGLAWSGMAFLVGFCDTKRGALVMKGVSRLALSWLKHVDVLQIRRRGASDGACALYFVGANAKTPVLTPDELVRDYRGVVR